MGKKPEGQNGGPTYENVKPAVTAGASGVYESPVDPINTGVVGSRESNYSAITPNFYSLGEKLGLKLPKLPPRLNASAGEATFTMPNNEQYLVPVEHVVVDPGTAGSTQYMIPLEFTTKEVAAIVNALAQPTSSATRAVPNNSPAPNGPPLPPPRS